jgi:hypothetical protein
MLALRNKRRKEVTVPKLDYRLFPVLLPDRPSEFLFYTRAGGGGKYPNDCF